MRKFTALLLSFVFVFALFALSGCDSQNKDDAPVEVIVIDNKQYDRITLSKDNYKDYISLNTSIIDALVDKKGNDDSAQYGIYIIAKLSTSTLGDYLFENCTLKYSIKIYDDESGWVWNIRDVTFMQLDYYGNSESSFIVKNENLSSVELLHISYSRIEVDLITGNVLVQKS